MSCALFSKDSVQHRATRPKTQQLLIKGCFAKSPFLSGSLVVVAVGQPFAGYFTAGVPQGGSLYL